MMTRKDYEAIARIMKGARGKRYVICHGEFNPHKVVTSIVEELADFMEYDNPNFQRTRFVEACKGDK